MQSQDKMTVERYESSFLRLLAPPQAGRRGVRPAGRRGGRGAGACPGAYPSPRPSDSMSGQPPDASAPPAATREGASASPATRCLETWSPRQTLTS